MARIIGLDLGSYAVKTVTLETSFRGSAFTRFESAFIDDALSPGDGLAGALAQLKALNALTGDAIITAFPGLHLATHALAFPFVDHKKIESTVAFEIEGQLPYDIETAVYDFQIGAPNPLGATVLAGVAKREDLKELLATLATAGVDPKIVSHAGLVPQNLLANLPADISPEATSIGIVDLGHQRICVTIGSPGTGLQFARTFHGGGFALTAQLAEAFGISSKEATAWKESHGAVGPDVVGPDAERGAKAMAMALAPTVRELRTTVKAARAQQSAPVRLLLLCGGTANLRGIGDFLAMELGIPCQPMPLPKVPQVPAVGLDAAQAIALAQRGIARGNRAPRFNLRRGTFAFRGDFGFLRAKLPQIGGIAAALLLLLIGTGVARNAILTRRDLQIDNAICQLTKEVLGRCEKNAEIAMATLADQDSISGVKLPSQSAVLLLHKLTLAIPGAINATLQEAVIELDRISIRCEAGSSEVMDSMITALAKERCFKRITEGKVEKSKDGNGISFRLDIEVQCPPEETASR